jgi:hypothetical protein
MCFFCAKFMTDNLGTQGIDWQDPVKGGGRDISGYAPYVDPTAQLQAAGLGGTPSPTPTPAPSQNQAGWNWDASTGTWSAGATQYPDRYSNTSYAQYLNNQLDQVAQATDNTYRPSNYSTGTQRFAVPQSYIAAQQSYAPVINGTPQTAGGGYTPDGSYSAGYHGSGGMGIGGGVDNGPWGTGPNNGPIINGTMQTGGGGYTPDGSYSAGYHGSGEHPEITGESTPGQYQSGSFGPIVKPDLSNGGKAGDFLRYISSMGFDISQWNTEAGRNELVKQYGQNGGNFDGVAFLKTLPQPDSTKTDLISQYASNPMMPTSQVYGLLGQDYSKLFQAPPPIESVLSVTTPPTAPTLSNLGEVVQQDQQKSYVNPYTGSIEYKRKRYKLYT